MYEDSKPNYVGKLEGSKNRTFEMFLFLAVLGDPQIAKQKFIDHHIPKEILQCGQKSLFPMIRVKWSSIHNKACISVHAKSHQSTQSAAISPVI